MNSCVNRLIFCAGCGKVGIQGFTVNIRKMGENDEKKSVSWSDGTGVYAYG